MKEGESVSALSNAATNGDDSVDSSSADAGEQGGPSYLVIGGYLEKGDVRGPSPGGLYYEIFGRWG